MNNKKNISAQTGVAINTTEPVVREVTIKDIDAVTQAETLKTLPIGAEFKDISSAKYNVSLEDWFEHYLRFMQKNQYTHIGAEEPSNPQIGLWIDTDPFNKKQQ